MSIKQWKSHSLMQNGVLFLHIHESVQASQNTENLTSTSLENKKTSLENCGANREQIYEKPDEYKYRKQHCAANRETNTENLTGTSLENNIKGSVNREQVLTKAYGV